MTALQAIARGIIQGLTEFLPVSSSGHLIVVPWLLGWPDQGLAFDVALHVGTLAAVVFAFLDDWRRLLAGAVRGALRGRPFAEPEGRLLGLIALACVPGAVAGLLLEERAETAFRSPPLVAAAMAGLGIVLFFADRRAGTAGPGSVCSVRDALLIGSAQALALVPGVSRSGATISMALFLGYRREEAARFSFLLATPITLGAAALKARALLAGGGVTYLGLVAAAVSGFFAIRFLLSYVRTRDYRPFVYYRLALAALVFGVLLIKSWA